MGNAGAMALETSVAWEAPPVTPALQDLDGAEWNRCVKHAASGDSNALERLYDGTRRMVYGLALRILGDRTDAEEATLDVYTQAWRTAGSFDPRRGNALAWLLMLTRSRSLDRLRSTSRRRGREESLEAYTEAPAAGFSPEQSSVLSQQRRRVREALQALPHEQREALELAFFSGLSHSELAAHLGEPLGTVKTRVRLGMMKMRELLGTR